MPNVKQHGSFGTAADLNENLISDRLAELSELVRSKGCVHTARMIEEAQNVYAFENKHLAAAEAYRSDARDLKLRSFEEPEKQGRRFPNFRSRRSGVPDDFLSDHAKGIVGPVQEKAARPSALVLTARMRVDGRNVATLRNGPRSSKPMRFAIEPEFQFR